MAGGRLCQKKETTLYYELRFAHSHSIVLGGFELMS
jgi:hypothetical protein